MWFLTKFLKPTSIFFINSKQIYEKHLKENGNFHQMTKRRKTGIRAGFTTIDTFLLAYNDSILSWNRFLIVLKNFKVNPLQLNKRMLFYLDYLTKVGFAILIANRGFRMISKNPTKENSYGADLYNCICIRNRS